MPFHTGHASFVKGPIDQHVGCLCNQSASVGVSSEPYANFTVASPHFERAEQNSADHFAFKPNRITTSLVCCLAICETLDERKRFFFGVDISPPRKPLTEMSSLPFDKREKHRRLVWFERTKFRCVVKSNRKQGRSLRSGRLCGTLQMLCTRQYQLKWSAMPALGDHEARREDVSEAVWRVLARCGVGGLTLRSVATEMDATTGLVSHYFPTKRALIAHARCVAELRTANMDRRTGEAPGIASLRAAILDVLPLTPEKIAMSKAWVSFWDAAIGDDALGASETIRYQKWRTRLCEMITEAQERNQLTKNIPPQDLSVLVGCFAHGLVVQALFDPKRLSPTHQTSLVDQFLAQFAN
jgi:AcrR family transcriptional regulator